MATHLLAGVRCAVLLLLVGLSERADFAAQPFREADLKLSALAYDYAGRHLYGAASNRLMQIDTESGAVLRSFDLQAPILRLESGAGASLWVGQEHAILRFDTATLAAGVPVTFDGLLDSLSPSPTEPSLAAFSTGSGSLIVRNGTLLPDGAPGVQAKALNGNYFFGTSGGTLYRYAIGAFGISPARISVLPGRGEDFKPLGGFIYHPAGAIDAASLDIVPGRSAALVAVNPDAQTVWTMAFPPYAPVHLNRFAHPGLRLTGFYPLEVGQLSATDLLSADLVAWSTNRIAFNGTRKLYLLDIDALFPPPGLSLAQTAPATVSIGHTVNFELIVTNRGPGAAFNVLVTNSLFPSFQLAALPPGASYRTNLSYLPVRLGNITNLATATAENAIDAPAGAASAVTGIVRPVVPFSRMPFAVSEFAFDPLSKKLSIVSDAVIGSFDPNTFEVAPTPVRTELIEIDNRLGFAFLAERNIFNGTTFRRLNLATGEVVDLFFYPFVSRDFLRIAGSPADPDLLAISDNSGTYLVRNGAVLPDHPASPGEFHFSGDGSKLYFANNSTACQIEVYRVGPTGLTLDGAISELGCSSFSVFNGLLYMDRGIAYDLAAGQPLPNTFPFPLPAFTVPHTNSVDILVRTNSVWTLRRFAGPEHLLARTLPLPDLDAPLEVIALGPDLLAIRNSSRQFYLVDLSLPSPLEIHASQLPGQLRLSFNTVRGQFYRVEAAPTLPAGAWLPVRENLAGTGDRLTLSFPLEPNSAFFRAVALPPVP